MSLSRLSFQTVGISTKMVIIHRKRPLLFVCWTPRKVLWMASPEICAPFSIRNLSFKWIKQHLHIKTFYGTTKNAVYTQIWIAVCDYLLLIIAKKRYGLVPSLHSISNSIGQVLFQRADIRELYNQPTVPVVVPEAGSGEQLMLW